MSDFYAVAVAARKMHREEFKDSGDSHLEFRRDQKSTSSPFERSFAGCAWRASVGSTASRDSAYFPASGEGEHAERMYAVGGRTEGDCCTAGANPHPPPLCASLHISPRTPT